MLVYIIMSRDGYKQKNLPSSSFFSTFILLRAIAFLTNYRNVFLRKRLPSKKYDPLTLFDSLYVFQIAATKQKRRIHMRIQSVYHTHDLFSTPHGTLSGDFS